MPGSILLIEDDPEFRATLRLPLEEAGFTVFEAPDGSSALQALDRLRTAVSLAVIDLTLPSVSGFEVLGALRRRSNPVKIIVLTGVLNDLYLEIARSMGADLALRKPPSGEAFPPGEWLAAVNRVLDSQDEDNKG